MATRLTKYNIVVLGESGVGKSCFIHMFVFDTFEQLYDPFSEPVARKRFEVDGHAYVLDLMDISPDSDPAHQSAYRALLDLSLVEADGVVLLYDTTSKKTFDHVQSSVFRSILKARADNLRPQPGLVPHIPPFGSILVGTKSDLQDQRQVATEDARDYATMMNMPFFELDSKRQRSAIHKAMEALVTSINRAKQDDCAPMLLTQRKKPSRSGSDLLHSLRRKLGL